jgi:general stress protein 26
MSTTASNEFQHLADLIRGMKTAMLTTASAEGSLRSRPMATLGGEFDGTLWFFTRADAPKVGEVQHDEQVNVSYADADGQRFVSVSGRASLVLDPKKANELWDPIHAAWFPRGVEDPQVALLRVNAEKAEYWDAKSSGMVPLNCVAQEPCAKRALRPIENQKLDVN